MRYELTSTTNQHGSRTLYQIKSLINIPEYDVKAGDLGGFIESESNFPQDSSGWVFEKALIMGDAIIHGGVFHGGEFHGGEFHGGVFHGGVFRGGVFRGGVFRGGEFRGGGFRGGWFHGGWFRGGWFHGDVKLKKPLFITGLTWDVSVSDEIMTIGCQSHRIDKWRGFSDEQIREMSSGDAEFWRTYKDVIFTMIDNRGDLC